MNTITPSSSLGDILIDALADAVDTVGDEVYELSRDHGGKTTTKAMIVVGLIGIIAIGGAVAIFTRR